MSALEIIGKRKIVLGETFTHVFKFRKNNGYDQVDISTATVISASFPLATGLWTTVTLAGGGITRVSGTIGDLSVTLAAATTALLKVGDGQNVEFSWTISSAVTLRVLERAIDIVDPASA